MTLDDNQQQVLINFLIKQMEKLQQKGLLPTNIDKSEIAKSVCSDLVKGNADIDIKNLQSNPELQKNLEFACVIKASGNQFDINILFKPLSATDPEILKQNVKLLFPELDKLTPQVKVNGSDDEKKAELIASKEARETLLDKAVDNANPTQMEKFFNAMLILTMVAAAKPKENDKEFDLVAEHLTALYGTDTRVEGAITGVVQENDIGNQSDFALMPEEQGAGLSLASDILNAIEEETPSLQVGGMQKACKEHDVFIDRTPTNSLLSK